MKAKLILAESATLHPDGTVSMLRAGITRLWSPEVPVVFRASLVVRIEAEAAERGKNEFEIHCINEDGKDQLSQIKGQFDSPKSGGDHQLIMAIQSKLSNFGLYQFNILINKVCLDSWNLIVARPEVKHDDDASGSISN